MGKLFTIQKDDESHLNILERLIFAQICNKNCVIF